MSNPTDFDTYIAQQVQPVLRPGEQITHQAFVVKAPGLLMQMLLLGPLLVWLMTTAYFAVITNHGRLLLIRTKLGFWGLKKMNLGMEDIPLQQVKQCSTSGFANNRSITFVFADGSKRTLRIAPWLKKVTGQKQFLEQVPQIINQRQIPGSV